MDFSTILLQWYGIHKRDLPWRLSKSPYYIWVSEIIMQQTRVEQGTPYYHNFIKNFPTVESLAKAPIDDVLKTWQGLGYYSRARNMHKAAIMICTELKHKFPANHVALREIPGIGEYTAAAISSICFNERVAAIDGNVNRVISRLFDIADPVDRSVGKKQIQEIMKNAILKTKQPGDFNQALMDFGSAICLPKAPDCNTCCLRTRCIAKMNNTIRERPIKTAKAKVKIRYLYYIYVEHENSTLLHKRNKKDIWQGLYEFPLIETIEYKPLDNILTNELIASLIPNNATIDIKEHPQKPHLLSHQKLIGTFISIKTNKLIIPDHYIKVPLKDLNNYAFPKLIDQFLIKQ